MNGLVSRFVRGATVEAETGKARKSCERRGPASPAGAMSPKQRDEDHVQPTQDAVDDRPQNRMVVDFGDTELRLRRSGKIVA
ncbi:hypothetical protein [Bradyrhizobium vignae]|uniref:Transposase n=1 Tax=Bradyrhizobium vignae TaxID=1549949 RepID=A0ABS4A9X9_9BRAD|nr:hypothetical protein [Bradyrhizobium vignae]MBP0116519.1 hypothetical protein [Bradyrhizobium vignae]